MSTQNYSKYLKEVTDCFLKLGTPVSKKEEKEVQQKYFRGTKYKIYNIKRVDLKSLLKFEFSFSKLNDKDKAKVWSYIFKNTKYLDVGSLAIDYFKQFQNKKTNPVHIHWPLIKTWIPHIENWVHGDMISGLYCDCLSAEPEKVYPHLLKWSKSSSPWKNRMAILSLLYYYNPKRNTVSFNKIVKIVKPHLKKDHYYLQKSVGWNIRELIKVYPKQGWIFLNSHYLTLSSTAFTTAVENIPKNKKEPLKKNRRLNRAKRSKSN